MGITIRLIDHGSIEYFDSVELRYLVLREPLHIDFTWSQLRNEKSDYHLAAFDDKMLCGILILTPISNSEVKMRQVAIAISHQRKGIGQILVAWAENFAIENRFTLISMHARKNAVPFYLKLGYLTVGDEFEEVTIPHYKMIKLLK